MKRSRRMMSSAATNCCFLPHLQTDPAPAVKYATSSVKHGTTNQYSVLNVATAAVVYVHRPSIDKNWPSSDLLTASSATTAAEFIGPYIWGNCCCLSASAPAGSSPVSTFECAGLSPTGAAERKKNVGRHERAGMTAVDRGRALRYMCGGIGYRRITKRGWKVEDTTCLEV